MGEAALVQAHDEPNVPAPNTGVPHLTPDEICDILRWDAQGLTQEQIGRKLNPPRPQATISRTLKEYGADSRVEAKRIFDAQAAPTALKILREGRPRDLIQVMQGRNVLEAEETRGSLTIVVGAGAAVQVNIGQRVDTPQDVAVGPALTKSE